MVTTLDIALGASLTEEDARAIFAQGEEAVIFAILALSKRLADQKATEAANWHQTPATPSGQHALADCGRLPSADAFAKKLRRLLGDAIRLWRQREDLAPETYASRRQRLTVRLQDLIDTDWRNDHAKRLIKRLRRHQNDLFTFLDHPLVPFDNHHGEREIRPAVIIRKNSYGNRSEHGANCQAVLLH